MTNLQKRSISKYSRHLCDLRNISSSLMNALEVEDCDTNIASLKEKILILTECYANISVRLDQFSVLLKSFPENDMNLESVPEFDAVLSDSPLTKCFKNNDEWNQLYNKIKAIISIVTKQKTALNKLVNSVPKEIGRDNTDLPHVSPSHIDVTNDAKANLITIATHIKGIIQEHKFVLKSMPHRDTIIPQHPVLRSLENLMEYLEITTNALDKIELNNEVSMETDSTATLIDQTEDIIASMLLVIQSLYKKHLPNNKSTDDIDVLNAIDAIIDGDKSEEKEQSKEILEDKHLKELLQENLSSDAKMFQIEILIEKMKGILFLYVDYLNTTKNVEDVRAVVTRLVPIAEQTVLFIHYFIAQKVAVHRVSCKMLSVLLKIFSELATKGFCKPSDLDMEDGEGEGGPGKSGGMGLGDGEGQKDVSERIENQDQLDDAHRPGEEKKQDDKDCKEEEKGINMSDDFDSHLQDVEQKEADGSDKEDDDDDADKQMGDIDNAAEKLDQQIWGSEDEEDQEEQEGKKSKEEKGKGESTGEKEMAAKEQEEGTDDGSEGKDKKKKKDINELDEPEVDDDHVDPYHGNQQQLPEPEDFDMPEDMKMDGDEGADDKEEGETETENPFEIDVAKANMQEEEETQKDQEEKEKDDKHGFEVSSDEEGGDNDDDKQDKEKSNEQVDDDDQTEGKKEEEDKKEGPDNEDDAETAEDNPEDKPKEAEKEEDEDINCDMEEDLLKNPEDITEEDKVDEKSHEANPQANPSSDDPSAGDRAENADADKGTTDNVDTNEQQAKDEDAAPFEQAQEQVGEEQQSMGRSELDKSERGHRGEKEAARADSARESRRRENKPGTTDQERTLGDINEKKRKQAQMLNVQPEEQGEGDGGEEGEERDEDADTYQHVKQARKDDLQVIDAATKEQAEQQPTLQKDDEEGEKMKEDEQVAMDIDEEDIQVEKSEEIKPEKVKDGPSKDQEKTGNNNDGGEDPTGEAAMEIDGDAVLTETVPRGRETTYHTRVTDSQDRADDISLEQYVSMRGYMEKNRVKCGEAAASAWRSAWRTSSPAARALCERLRLVLEPTGRSRKAGDYRTGRAINMRRVIPYIASHYRKDRIWLRRSKPARRDYKIAIAVDDSSSMDGNRSKELAFESLALVSQALNLLESGDLAVLSFGERPSLLHPFTEQFTEHSGAKVLEELRFDQTKTRIAQLLDFCTVLFDEQAVRSDAINAKLLVIVSDGRGIFSEGETRVLQAVRRARQQGIFLVYVIIDNPDNKDSIMDIRRPILDPVSNTLSGFVPYLDTFPFPFYLILRDMSALPTVLGDALRQWFELAANSN